MAESALPRGIDVSNWQGVVDWPAVAADGIRFAFAKATEGTFFNDPYFARNWAGAKAAGLVRGAYHFARPSASTPDAEAAFFLAAVERAGGLKVGDILVLDIEDEKYLRGGSYGTAGKWSLGFCRYIEAAVGFKPIVYTGPWYISSRGFADTPELAEFGLWLAAYQPSMPAAPAPWPLVAFWQFTSKGRVRGVAGDCDVNVFNGAPDRIAAYGKPARPEPKPEPPTSEPPTSEPTVELLARVAALEARLAGDVDGILTRLARIENGVDEDLIRVAAALRKAADEIAI